VVDAIIGHPNSKIANPDDHNIQDSIAEGFHQVLSANFKRFAGAIDGILIWIHKPSRREYITSGCGSGKLYCG
jgi:hypothetical protein